ncbi:MAG TPA: TIGR01212 family radical SAM protein [bacterium]|nr:TIGR01212 family radical SAM protein [bacterium]HOL47073.1 TIGR01212 family radical SAM protein [bacterium]HPQ18973.1 TIGR01212 family radical SAM protein [bacterium]
MENYFYKLSDYYKKRFGEKVYKIAVDAKFQCPNRNGTLSNKGCIFCSPESYSGVLFPDLPVNLQVSESIKFYKTKNKAKKFIVYLQPNTNTYTTDYYSFAKLLKQLIIYDEVIGISISTRPDCINEEIIKIIKSAVSEKYLMIELGLQSINNETLKFLNRNHTVEDFYSAVELIKKYNIEICSHIILGLPTDKEETIIEMAKKLSEIKIDGVKIHHFHIVRNTYAAKLYEEGKINLLTYEEYLNYLVNFLEHLKEDIVIHRLIADVQADYLIAPVYNKTKTELVNDLINLFKLRKTRQGVKN